MLLFARASGPLLLAFLTLGAGMPEMRDDRVTGSARQRNHGPAYTKQELCDEIETLFGTERADELRNDGPEIIELGHTNAEGAHDRDTVGLNTKNENGETRQSKTEAALVYEHEARHSAAAAQAGLTFDPNTRGPSGACVHAEYHFDGVLRVILHTCGSFESEEQRIQVCNALSHGLENGNRWMADCENGPHPPSADHATQAYQECCAL